MGRLPSSMVAEGVRTGRRLRAMRCRALLSQSSLPILKAGGQFKRQWRRAVSSLATPLCCLNPVALVNPLGSRSDHSPVISILLILQQKIIRTRSSKCGWFGETAQTENCSRPSRVHTVGEKVRLLPPKPRVPWALGWPPRLAEISRADVGGGGSGTFRLKEIFRVFKLICGFLRANVCGKCVWFE